MALGLGIVVYWATQSGPAAAIISAFKSRVIADGGTVESPSCAKLDIAYLTSNPAAPAGYTAEWSAATVGSSAEFRINLVGGAGYTYTYAVTDTQATEVTGSGVMSGNIQAVVADLSTLVDGQVTLAVYLTGAGGDGNVVTDTANLVGYTGLLDTYSGAAAAYSLRLLDTSYTGSAVRVRRASDNAEQDIAFSNNELDTATLETFASGTDAFVTTWYDQSGNANNATQTTAADQPQIVSSGSTILENGKAAIQWDGGNDFFNTTLTSPLSQPNTIITIHKYNNSFDSQHDLIDSTPSSERTLIDTSGNTYRLFAGSVASSGVSSTTNQTLLYGVLNSSNSELSINGVNTTNLNAGINGLDSFAIGNTSSNYLDGRMQEIIIYNSNESTNRSGIETNINDFYSIY